MGIFDHLKETYDEAFEQFFGPGTEGFEQKFPIIQMPRGFAGGREGC